MIRFLLCFSFLFLMLFAQAQYKLSGKIVDQENKVLSFITIKIKGDKNQVNYTQTDSLGFYFFKNLKSNNYSLSFSALGFKSQERGIALTSDTLINVILENAENTLAEVQVSSKKALIEKKIDRTIFNAENSIAAIGTDALELLAKVPGVRVLNDRVSLVGKGGVNVMVNDKLVQLSEDDLSNYLKSISSSNISKIEVITNPPAKYDAQGNNGLINIVLKRTTDEGFKGSINTVFTQASYPTFSGGGNLSYRKDKIILYGNFNLRKGSTVPFEQSDIFYPDQTWNIVNKDRNFRTVPSGQLGVDYQISKNTVLGLSYNGGKTDFHSEEHIKTTIFNHAQSIDSVLNSEASAKIRLNYNSANLYLKQLLDSTGKQMIINGDWFKYNDDKSRFFNNTSYFQSGQVIPDSFAEYLSTSQQNIDLYTLKADVDLPYKLFKLSVGTKLSFIKNESDVSFYKKRNDIYEVDHDQSNRFDYSENTQALYLNLNRKLAKWDFQMGLRGEYTQIDGVSVNEHNQNDYFRLFPTLFATYHLSEKSVFSVNYGRRINRPAYRKLNPFRWYSNQYAYAEGNPFLQPSYNNNIELSHTYANVFSTTLSFSNTTNGYNDVNFIDVNSNVQVLRPINFITAYHYQFSNSIVLNQLDWLESNNQLDVFYTVSNSKLPQTLTKLNGLGAYFSSLNQFVFNRSKTFLGDVGFWYQFPGVDGLNKTKSQSNLDMGLKTLLLNKKLQVAINASDILKTNKQRFSSLVNNIQQEYNNYYDSRQLRVTLRYNFGNEKIKQQDRRPGNEEERRRSN